MSDCIPVASPSTAAAAAEGASPTGSCPRSLAHPREHAHRRRLAGTRWRQRERDLSWVAEEGADELALAVVQHRSVEGGRHQGELDIDGIRSGAGGAAGGLDDPLLGVEHPLAGVVVGSGVAVDADAIGPTKHLGVDDRVEVGRQVDQRTGDRVDQVLDDLADLIAR